MRKKILTLLIMIAMCIPFVEPIFADSSPNNGTPQVSQYTAADCPNHFAPETTMYWPTFTHDKSVEPYTHVRVCILCGTVDTSETECIDSDGNDDCDICGGPMGGSVLRKCNGDDHTSGPTYFMSLGGSSNQHVVLCHDTQEMGGSCQRGVVLTCFDLDGDDTCDGCGRTGLNSVPVKTTVDETFTVQLPLTIGLNGTPDGSDSTKTKFSSGNVPVKAKGNISAGHVLKVTPSTSVTMNGNNTGQQFTLNTGMIDSGTLHPVTLVWHSKNDSFSGGFDVGTGMWRYGLSDSYTFANIQIENSVTTPAPDTYVGNMRFTIAIE